MKYPSLKIEGQAQKVLLQANETHEIADQVLHVLRELGETLFRYKVERRQARGNNVFHCCRVARY